MFSRIRCPIDAKGAVAAVLTAEIWHFFGSQACSGRMLERFGPLDSPPPPLHPMLADFQGYQWPPSGCFKLRGTAQGACERRAQRQARRKWTAARRGRAA